jgi:hypothetical protein
MKPNRLILIAPLMALAAGASARNIDVTVLARQTGLTERQVRMVLGAPGAYAEYRTSYWTAERRVSQALSGGYEEREPPLHRAQPHPAESVHAEPARPAAQVAPYRETEQRLRVENVDADDGDDSDEH